MSLAAILIPPSLDAKQALRLRRFGLAALTYALSTALVVVAWTFGVLPGPAALSIAAAFLVINLGLYAAIRSGLNLRFDDPSLTFFQILAAITVLMYVVYHMDDGRNIALFGCFVVFQFGIFRLNAREFTLVTLYTLAAYALVINLLMHLRPEAIDDVRKEWMSWLMLAGFLPVFTIVGKQINALRRKLRESEARFRQTFELAGSGIAHVGLDGRFLHVNHSLCAILGRSSEDLLGRTVKELSHPEDRDKTDAARARVRAGEVESIRAEKRYLRKDGAAVWVDLTVSLVRDGRGKPLYEIAVFDDTTERKNAESALRDSAEELRKFAENVPAMTVSWDENLRCQFANKAYSDFFHPAGGEVAGKHARDVLGEAGYRKVEAHFAQALQGHSVNYQTTFERPNARIRHLEIKHLPHLGAHGKLLGFYSVITDISDYKLAEERIQRVAHHDSLTGLPNRLLFNDRLQQAISRAQRESRQCALLYLDLNGFKPVNDALGHAAGDELLQGVAARIRHAVRDSDTVARVGGDEFVVILPDIPGRDDAKIVAGKITAALAAPFQLGSQKQSVDIGASIGIAVYPADAQDADTLVKVADAAMYGDKQAGRKPLATAA